MPVVSTDAPHGPHHILADGRFGPIGPVGDAEALAAAIAATLDQPTPKAILEERASVFDIEQVADARETLIIQASSEGLLNRAATCSLLIENI